MINFYMQFYRLEVCVVVFPLLLFLFVILIKSTTIDHFNKSFLAMSPDRDKVKGAQSYQIFKNIFISNQQVSVITAPPPPLPHSMLVWPKAVDLIKI